MSSGLYLCERAHKNDVLPLEQLNVSLLLVR